MMEVRNFQIPYFGTFLVACGLFGTGIASSYWIFTPGVYNCGLWWECIDEQCKSLVTSEAQDYITAIQIMMSLAVVALVAALGSYILWMAPTGQNTDDFTRMLSGILTIMAGLLGFTGVVTYGISHLHNEPLKAISRVAIPNGWAYWLSVHSSLVILVMGCINASYAASKTSLQRDPEYWGKELENFSSRSCTDSDTNDSLLRPPKGASYAVT